MNIVVCDNQLDYQNLIEKKLYECFEEKYIKLNVYKCADVPELLHTLKKKVFQFAFIEMKIENQRGIEVAKILQKVNPSCRIIFMSHKYLRLTEAYQVNALNYILKPICTEDFRNTLRDIMKWYTRQNVKFHTMDKSLNMRIFNVDQVKYVRTDYERITIVTRDDESHTSAVKNRVKIREALKPRWFMQVNGSILVNMKLVEYMDANKIVLTTHEEFAVAPPQFKEAKIKYTQFMKDKKYYGYA